MHMITLLQLVWSISSAHGQQSESIYVYAHAYVQANAYMHMSVTVYNSVITFQMCVHVYTPS